MRELKARGVTFMGEAHLIAPMPDHDQGYTPRV